MYFIWIKYLHLLILMSYKWEDAYHENNNLKVRNAQCIWRFNLSFMRIWCTPIIYQALEFDGLLQRWSGVQQIDIYSQIQS